jgi:hypothetical protein
MFSSVIESLFGRGGSKQPSMGGMLMRASRILAWKHRHDVARLEHLETVLVELVDVQKALEARGAHVADVQAVLAQLLDDLPRRDADAPEIAPTFDPRFESLMTGAVVGSAISTVRLVDGIAGALPPELAFLRRPLAATATELGATFDATLSSTKDGGLTFEGWDPELKKCMGLMQRLADERWGSWSLEPRHLFLALLFHKPYFAYFRARGQDSVALIGEMASRGGTPTWPARDRPPSLIPEISPRLFALMLRAERSAASDATDVRLRHLLLALHDEPDLMLAVDRLAG